MRAGERDSSSQISALVVGAVIVNDRVPQIRQHVVEFAPAMLREHVDGVVGVVGDVGDHLGERSHRPVEKGLLIPRVPVSRVRYVEPWNGQERSEPESKARRAPAAPTAPQRDECV